MIVEKDAHEEVMSMAILLVVEFSGTARFSPHLGSPMLVTVREHRALGTGL